MRNTLLTLLAVTILALPGCPREERVIVEDAPEATEPMPPAEPQTAPPPTNDTPGAMPPHYDDRGAQPPR